jgi:hypothetical protein
MQKNIPNQDPNDRMVSCKEAAAILNVKAQTLAKWRSNKTYQLLYVKIGKRRVSYKISDLMNFCQTFGWSKEDGQNNNNQ